MERADHAVHGNHSHSARNNRTYTNLDTQDNAFITDYSVQHTVLVRNSLLENQLFLTLLVQSEYTVQCLYHYIDLRLLRVVILHIMFNI